MFERTIPAAAATLEEDLALLTDALVCSNYFDSPTMSSVMSYLILNFRKTAFLRMFSLDWMMLRDHGSSFHMSRYCHCSEQGMPLPLNTPREL